MLFLCTSRMVKSDLNVKTIKVLSPYALKEIISVLFDIHIQYVLNKYVFIKNHWLEFNYTCADVMTENSLDYICVCYNYSLDIVNKQ